MNSKRTAHTIMGMIVLAGTVGIAIARPSQTREPVYLTHTWFHRGPDVNLLTGPAGRRVVVDDQGRYLTDESINRECNRFIKLSLDSTQKVGDDYYMARPYGWHGNNLYDWFRVSNAGKFLDAKAVEKTVQGQISAHKPRLATFGFYYDYDPVRGDAGMLPFPKAGLAVILRDRRRTPANSASVRSAWTPLPSRSRIRTRSRCRSARRPDRAYARATWKTASSRTPTARASGSSARRTASWPSCTQSRAGRPTAPGA